MSNEDKMNAGAPALEMPEALGAGATSGSEVKTPRAEPEALGAKK